MQEGRGEIATPRMGSGYRFAAGKIGASSSVAVAISVISCDRSGFALFLRSPHAQVAILAIEKTEALANPGVAALHRRGNYRRQTQRRAVRLRRHGKGRQADEGTARPLLARGKVRHVGDLWRCSSPTASRRPVTLPSASASNTGPGGGDGGRRGDDAGAPQLYQDVPGNLFVIGRSAMRRRPTPPLPRLVTLLRSISLTVGWCAMQWNRGRVDWGQYRAYISTFGPNIFDQPLSTVARRRL
jgi:hypothetical protein